MLYDQALLLSLLTELNLHKNGEFSGVMDEITEFITEQLLDDNHAGFFVGQDADSLMSFGDIEKVEGAFALWNYEEVLNVLGENDSKLFIEFYDIKINGNIKNESHSSLQKSNVLHQRVDIQEFCIDKNLSIIEFKEYLNECLKKLRLKRKQRPQPLTDKKILTAWNGLTLAAISKTFFLCNNNEKLLKILKNVFDSLLITNYDLDLHFLKRIFYAKENKSTESACADDYAFLIDALIELYSATSEAKYLEIARKLQLEFDQNFWDYMGKGGYYYSKRDSLELLSRQKEKYSGAIPSSNGIALRNIIRLGLYNFPFENIDKKINDICQIASSCPILLGSYLLHLSAPLEINIYGKLGNDLKLKLSQAIYRINPLSILNLRESSIESFKGSICRGNICIDNSDSFEELLDILSLY